jgi:hypothetical protein
LNGRPYRPNTYSGQRNGGRDDLDWRLHSKSFDREALDRRDPSMTTIEIPLSKSCGIPLFHNASEEFKRDCEVEKKQTHLLGGDPATVCPKYS